MTGYVDLNCALCEGYPVFFCYDTPVCPRCARVARAVVVIDSAGARIELIHPDRPAHSLLRSAGDSAKRLLRAWEPLMGERLEQIATGQADAVDPVFLADLDEFVARMGMTPAAARAFAYVRQRQQAAVAEVERLLRAS